MRFQSLFTGPQMAPTSKTTTAAALVLGLSLCATGVSAQDRTTEAGEAAINGEYPFGCFCLIGRCGVQ